MSPDALQRLDNLMGPGDLAVPGVASSTPPDPAGFDALVRASSPDAAVPPRVRSLDADEVAGLAARPEPDVAAEADAAFRGTGEATPETYAGLRLGELFSQAASSLERAQAAERAVAGGGGSVLEMSVERAKANAMLGVASAAAGKLSSALSTFVNMAV